MQRGSRTLNWAQVVQDAAAVKWRQGSHPTSVYSSSCERLKLQHMNFVSTRFAEARMARAEKPASVNNGPDARATLQACEARQQ